MKKFTLLLISLLVVSLFAKVNLFSNAETKPVS